MLKSRYILLSLGLLASREIMQAQQPITKSQTFKATATIVGMLPVALRIGQAAEIRAPMAVVVIGGLIVSTLLTLIVIPVLYSLFDDWFNKKRRRG